MNQRFLITMLMIINMVAIVIGLIAIHISIAEWLIMWSMVTSSFFCRRLFVALIGINISNISAIALGSEIRFADLAFINGSIYLVLIMARVFIDIRSLLR